MRLGEIMTTTVETVQATDTAEAAWQRMRQRRIRHLVVMEGREVVGVASARDLDGHAGAVVRAGRRVLDVMTTPVITADPATTIRKAANLMRGRSVGCLPVLYHGIVVGIVTTTDLLELLGKGAARPSPGSRRPVLNGRRRRLKPFSQEAW